MRGVLNELYPIVAEDELQDALEKVLCDFYEEPVTFTQWHRRVSDYSSSHLIEEIDVRVAGQSELKLIFKDLSRNALLTGANGNRLPLGDDALREIEAYRKVLRHSQLGTATFYGAHVDETVERYWLFLERLEPVHLWQMGEFAVWERVAAWLARTHTTLANCATLRGQTSATATFTISGSGVRRNLSATGINQSIKARRERLILLPRITTGSSNGFSLFH